MLNAEWVRISKRELKGDLDIEVENVWCPFWNLKKRIESCQPAPPSRHHAYPRISKRELKEAGLLDALAFNAVK